MPFSTPLLIVSLMESGLRSLGNCGEEKNASRADFVSHSLNAGGQLRTRKLGLTGFCSIWADNLLRMKAVRESAALEVTNPRSSWPIWLSLLSTKAFL